MAEIKDFDKLTGDIASLSDTKISFIQNSSDMLPLLRKGKDKVTVSKLTGAPKKNDVVLCRLNDGGCILHRVNYIGKGELVLCGDNDENNDYHIKLEQIVGVLVSYERNGKTHYVTDRDYRLYVMLLPLIKAVRKYIKLLSENTKEFIRFLKKR